MEKQTLGEIASRKLMDMIQEKGYGAGDKLPTEAELVEYLGVGRNTVREAPADPHVQEYCDHTPGIGDLYIRKEWCCR